MLGGNVKSESKSTEVVIFIPLYVFYSIQHEKHFTANCENWHLLTYFIISCDLLRIIIIVHCPS